MFSKSFHVIGYLFLLILVAGNIFWTKRISNDIAAVKETIASATLSNGENDAPKPEVKTETPIEKKKIDITIDENGFSPNMIQVYSGEKLEISVTNNDKVAHTFEIKDLGINWKPIDPGKNAKITVENLPAESQTLNFVSNTGSDNNQAFEGIMMVLKK